MEAFAAESGGMPQLNPEFWISQIFWLTITFGILYVVLSKLILPKIRANLEIRKSQILENIEAAEKQREASELKIKEYEKKYPDENNVPRPPYWSGWRLLPDEIEFWVDGEGRIHERLNYKNFNGKWNKEILYP